MNPPTWTIAWSRLGLWFLLGHNKLALASICLLFPRIDVKFGMGITALVALLICDWPAYAPKHPRRGVEP